jgi:DNA-binding response OmpR family regulator
MKIAILDDDPVMLDAVATLLRAAGHDCDTYERGKALLDALRLAHYDMFVLDWNVPDISGLTVLDRIRNQLGSSAPCLMLTSRSLEEEVVAGLSAGADDYVAKPFQPAVLQARVMALGRRVKTAQGEDEAESYGPYSFDAKQRQLRVGDAEIVLTAKEFQLALFLFRNVDRAVSRQHVLESIWGLRADIPTRTLDIHIARLRSKLGLRAETGFQLVSVYGFGYRLEEVMRA